MIIGIGIGIGFSGSSTPSLPPGTPMVTDMAGVGTLTSLVALTTALAGSGVVASAVAQPSAIAGTSAVVSASLIPAATQYAWYKAAVANVTLSSASVGDASAFDSANWTKTNITIAANDTTDSDGGSAADKLTDTATNNVHTVAHAITNGSSETITLRIRAKRSAGNNWIIVGTSTGTFTAAFDLLNGATGTVVGTGATSAITSLGSGWYLCDLTFSYVSGNFQVNLSTDGTTTSYAGGSNAVWLYKAEVLQDRVSQLNDLASTRHLVQATVGNQPLWVASSANMANKPSIKFDGADQLAHGTAADWQFLNDGSGCTVFVVFYSANTTSVRLMTTNGASLSATGIYLNHDGANTRMRLFAGSAGVAMLSVSGANASTAAGKHKLYWTFATADTPDCSLSQDAASLSTGNETTTPTAGAPSSGLVVANSASGFIGEVAEIIFYARSLSASEITQTLAYLNQEYP